MSVLDDLRNQGLIEKVTVDRTLAAGWLEDSHRHLKAANQIAELDPSGAYVLAYDAARKSVAAALLMSGHRVLSRPGAHRALADYAKWLATNTGEHALTPERTPEKGTAPRGSLSSTSVSGVASQIRGLLDETGARHGSPPRTSDQSRKAPGQASDS